MKNNILKGQDIREKIYLLVNSRHSSTDIMPINFDFDYKFNENLFFFNVVSKKEKYSQLLSFIPIVT